MTLRHALDAGLDAVCFEQGQDVGGLWVLDNSNGRGGAYESLRLISSKKNTHFQDYPLPEGLEDFPHHRDVARYFSDYAEHFELRSAIRFGHEVQKCEPLAEGGYRLHFTEGLPSQDYDALIVASGHHFCPQYPPEAVHQKFKGRLMHSYDYKSPTRPFDLRDQKVLVVGMGNSAMDIASELSKTSAVTVSARRGAWVMPRYFRGKPIDGPAVIPLWLPGKLRRYLVTRSFQWLFGKMSDYGLPEPDHLIGEAHPTISTEFPHLVRAGKIQMQKGLVQARGKTAFFADGESADFDTIVFCTGYRVEFPFFAKEHLHAPDNRLPLFYRTFHPQHRHVFFVGLLQTVGAVMPVAEAQAKVIVRHLLGGYNLPSPDAMARQITRQQQRIKKRFVATPRHTMQIIPADFHAELEVELAQGAQRAQTKQGLSFPRGTSQP